MPLLFMSEKNKIRTDKDTYFLKIAKLTSERGTCVRRKVGCVIVDKHNHVMATGYNGVPKNFPHCFYNPCLGANSKTGKNLNQCLAIHAEQNALLQCKDIMAIDTIYCTITPCITCAKLIANTSCNRVVCSEKYSDEEALNLLYFAKIQVDLCKI